MLPARPDPNLLAPGIPCWDSSGSSSQTDLGNGCCGSWAPSWIRGRRKEWEFADRRPQDEFFPKKSTSQARPGGFGCPGLSQGSLLSLTSPGIPRSPSRDFGAQGIEDLSQNVPPCPSLRNRAWSCRCPGRARARLQPLPCNYGIFLVSLPLPIPGPQPPQDEPGKVPGSGSGKSRLPKGREEQEPLAGLAASPGPAPTAAIPVLPVPPALPGLGGTGGAGLGQAGKSAGSGGSSGGCRAPRPVPLGASSRLVVPQTLDLMLEVLLGAVPVPSAALGMGFLLD